LQHIINLGTWQRDAKSGRIEAIVNLPSRKTAPEDPDEVERRITTQEEEQIRERQNEIDRYTFDHTPDSLISVDDYKSPFTEEYDQAIAYQAQLQTINGNNEWNFKDFYRDVKTKFEQNTNTKAVFEKCIKLARYDIFLNQHRNL
jgi:N-acetylneuraminic acid mutarotase